MRQTLLTGLHLIVAQEPGSPLTAIEIRVRVGSGKETAGTNGLSHLVEHMVFKGAAGGAPGDTDRAIEALEGEVSARTSRDSTRYATLVPTENWQGALEKLAVLVLHPAFRDADLAAERSVIHSEMAETDSSPERAAFSDLAAIAFDPEDPDRFPIMGDPAALDSYDAATLRRFWQKWYRPENLTVVIVGAVSPEIAARTVDSLFPPGPALPPPLSPKAAAPAASVAAAPRPVGIVFAPPREGALHIDRDLVSVYLAFPGPPASDTADVPAEEVLLPLLDGGAPNAAVANGRLGQALLEDKQVAYSVSAAYLPGVQKGLILLSATGPGDQASAIEAALLNVVAQLRDNPVSDDEVVNARNSASGAVRGGDQDPSGMARRLADADARGLPSELADSYAERIAAVTTEDVRNLIQRYLTPDHGFVAIFGPQKARQTRRGAAQ